MMRSKVGNFLFFMIVALTVFIFSSHYKPRYYKSGSPLYSILLTQIDVGKKDSMYEGWYSVYENRKVKTGRKISLYVSVIPSLHPSSESPLFYFAGGPGGSASRMKNFFINQTSYRSNRDIVLIDVRGTGKSAPLHCDAVQIKKTAQECMDEIFSENDVKKCFDILSRSADLSQYTTEHVVEDIEEIRKWLGYDVINVMGQSYGTRVCQSYLRQYPASIKTAVMIGPAALSMGVPAYHAYDAQHAWELLLEDCRNDSSCNKRYPRLKMEFNNIIQRLSDNPDYFLFENKLTGFKETVLIKKGPFADLLRSIMYTIRGQRQIPYLVHEAYKGNYQPLIAIAIARKSDPNSIASGFYLCITCNEDIPLINKQKADQISAGTYMGNYRIEQQMAACDLWDSCVIHDDFFKPVKTALPVLVVSGVNDPVTPSNWGDTIIQNMPNAHHLRIPNMAHGANGQSGEKALHEFITSFFNDPFGTLDTSFIKKMQSPEFR